MRILVMVRLADDGDFEMAVLGREDVAEETAQKLTELGLDTGQITGAGLWLLPFPARWRAPTHAEVAEITRTTWHQVGYPQVEWQARGESLVTSVRLEAEGTHERVKVWVRHGLAGELVVPAGEGGMLRRLLMPESTPPASSPGWARLQADLDARAEMEQARRGNSIEEIKP